MMARSRRPFVVVISGAFRRACACFKLSQLPVRTPMHFALFTRAIPAANSGTSSPLSVASTASLRMADMRMMIDEDPAGLDALKDALSDKDWSVRATAVHSLSLRNDPALKKELEPLLQDDKEAVRMRAAAGYLRLSAIQAGLGLGNAPLPRPLSPARNSRRTKLSRMSRYWRMAIASRSPLPDSSPRRPLFPCVSEPPEMNRRAPTKRRKDSPETTMSNAEATTRETAAAVAEQGTQDAPETASSDASQKKSAPKGQKAPRAPSSTACTSLFTPI